MLLPLLDAYNVIDRMKEEELVKISERNARIKEIMEELKISEPLYTPSPHLLENPQQLLTVLL